VRKPAQALAARRVGGSAGFGGWSPSLGQGAALPRLGVEEAGLPVAEGRHPAAGVAVPAGAAGVGQVPQWCSAPLAESDRHRRSLHVPLRTFETKQAKQKWLFRYKIV